MQFKSKQFYLEFRERKQDLQLVQLNTGFRKKQDPLIIVLSCKVANNKDIQKKLFFISKLAEYDWKMYEQEENEEQEI